MRLTFPSFLDVFSLVSHIVRVFLLSFFFNLLSLSLSPVTWHAFVAQYVSTQPCIIDYTKKDLFFF